MTPTEKAARWYCTEGYSVIPIRADASKKPLVKWEQYQKEKAPLQQIEEWWQRWPDANIGIVTGEISGISVVDKDLHKMSPEQKAETAKLLPPENTPTANSISGGEHVYYQYHADIPQTAGLIPHVDTRNNGGYIIAPPSAINGRKYLWQAGKAINNLSLAIIQKHTLSILLSSTRDLGLSREGVNHTKPHETTTNHISFEEGNRDQALFHVANCLTKGGMPVNEMQGLLSLMASKLCNPPYDQNEITAKIRSAIQRAEKREYNIAQEVREWVLTTSGHFLTTDNHRELQLTTKDQRKAANMALLRLVEEGLLEKYGDKRGSYRIKDQACEPIEFKKVSQTDVDLRLPLGLNRYLWIRPKNIIVFAGSPDAGKTALLLNIVRDNMHRHKINYFSSEMGGEELNSRLANFEGIEPNEWPFEAKERSRNFADVIQPNEINIIDFLEISDAFYKIAGEMKDIHDRLKKGVAVIALQKDPKALTGRGGSFSEEKPRLYCIIDKDFPGQKIKIVKAKNWRDPEISPIGLARKFKLVGGCRILPTDLWERE